MKTILVIDDEKSWGDSLVTQLNKFSYNTILATSGQEGIEFAHKYFPDLILCDISLPDIDGFEVYEELHKTEFERIAPFIFISGKTDFSNINKKIKDLNCEFLTKPVRLKKIIETIEKIIGSNIFAKENVIFRNLCLYLIMN
jgi:DNA-binding NtrC family response regulator